MKHARFMLATIAALAAAPAAATDFTQQIVNEDGKAFTRCLEFAPPDKGSVCLREVPTTLGQVIFDALNVPDSGVTNDGIVSRGLLALKVREATDVELNDKERDAIKSALYSAVKGLGYRPVLVVKVLGIIDPAAIKDK